MFTLMIQNVYNEAEASAQDCCQHEHTDEENNVLTCTATNEVASPGECKYNESQSSSPASPPCYCNALAISSPSDSTTKNELLSSSETSGTSQSFDADVEGNLLPVAVKQWEQAETISFDVVGNCISGEA